MLQDFWFKAELVPISAPPLPGCHADRTAGGLTEDDRIQELLNRSDTAIIYPEAVSDHDDDNHGNQDATEQPNGVLSNSSNTDVHSNHNEDADSEGRLLLN